MDLLDDDDDEPEAPRGPRRRRAKQVAGRSKGLCGRPTCCASRRRCTSSAWRMKPQAIRRLMGCDGEERADAQHQSHLQAPPLLLEAVAPRRRGGGGDDDDGERARSTRTSSASQRPPRPARAARRYTQLSPAVDAGALPLDVAHAGAAGAAPAQPGRLARHVLMQRNMLQHLVALLHSSTVEIFAGARRAAGQIEATAHQALLPRARRRRAGRRAARRRGDASATARRRPRRAAHPVLSRPGASARPCHPNAFVCRIAPIDRIQPLPHSSRSPTCRCRPPRR